MTLTIVRCNCPGFVRWASNQQRRPRRREGGRTEASEGGLGQRCSHRAGDTGATHQSPREEDAPSRRGVRGTAALLHLDPGFTASRTGRMGFCRFMQPLPHPPVRACRRPYTLTSHTHTASGTLGPSASLGHSPSALSSTGWRSCDQAALQGSVGSGWYPLLAQGKPRFPEVSAGPRSCGPGVRWEQEHGPGLPALSPRTGVRPPAAQPPPAQPRSCAGRFCSSSFRLKKILPWEAGQSAELGTQGSVALLGVLRGLWAGRGWAGPRSDGDPTLDFPRRREPPWGPLPTTHVRLGLGAPAVVGVLCVSRRTRDGG